MLRNLKTAIILLLINSSNLFSQDKINVPVTGDWEYGGVLLDNENLIVEIDFKLTQFECEKSNFGNSDNLFRYRITNKKKNLVLEDNFLSFTTLNLGSQIQYLFIDKDPQHEIISIHGLFSDGSIKRYPALKSRQLGYEFMPRLAKQVGSKELFMPFIYMGKIGFSKITF
jgi:hypothetical protein